MIAWKNFESYSTAKGKVRYKNYIIGIPPNNFLLVDIDDDKQLKEREAFLKNFLATNIKFEK